MCLDLKGSPVINHIKQPVLIVIERRRCNDFTTGVSRKMLDIHISGVGFQILLIEPRRFLKPIEGENTGHNFWRISPLPYSRYQGWTRRLNHNGRSLRALSSATCLLIQFLRFP